MAKNKDSEFADLYQIPVQVLHEGLPARLRGAPDDEVRDGNLIRVATAAGLAAALALQAPGKGPLQAYIVYYLAPAEAELIAAMVETAKIKPQAEAGGDVLVTVVSAPQAEAGTAAAAAAAAGPSFVIVNKRVLEAKLLALMAIRGELTDINVTMKQVRNKKQAPFYVTETALVDHGLTHGKHLKPLKQAYFAARALAGHYKIAKAILKGIDRPMYTSLLKSFPMTVVDQHKHMLELAVDYQEQYPQHKSQTLAEISQQLLGLVTFLDLHDTKRLLTPTDLSAVSNDRRMLLKLLKGQIQKFSELIDGQSLLGAEFVDFPRLRDLGGAA